MRAALRRQAGITLAVWAIAFSLLAVVSALPSGPSAALVVDTRTPFVAQVVGFDASGSLGHDQGNGRIVAYAFAFGDGGTTAWQESPFANHAYGTAGEYTGTVTVKDGRGLTGQASVSVSVRTAPSPGTSPNLVPIGASFSPAHPRVGDNVTLVVTLMNLGGATATNASVQLTDVRPSGTKLDLGLVPMPQPLAPRAMETITAPSFVAVEAGNHTLRIVVREVSPPEVGQGDNEYDLTMPVLPAGSPTPNGGTAFPVDPLALGLIGLAVVSLIGALVFLLRPRPPGPLEPPPASPPDQSPPPIWPP